MKHLFMFAALAIGAMTLASCSNDEVIETTNAGAIGFKAMSNKVTRAEVTTDNFTRFRVFGCLTDAGATTNHVVNFPAATATQVTKNEGTWSYSPLQYWAPNKDYYFVAISSNVDNRKWEYTEPESHPAALTTAGFKGYGTVSFNNGATGAQGNNDLVYAYATRTTDATISNDAVVPFTFNHMLSRIKFKFINAVSSEAANYTFQIKDLKFTSAASGTVELGGEPADLAWQLGTTGEPASVAMATFDGSIADTAIPKKTGSPENDSSYSKVSNPSFIIPGTYSIGISFDIQVLLNDTPYVKHSRTGSVTITDGFKPGKSYLLSCSIDEENINPGGVKPIKFTVTSVTDWGPDNKGDISLD